MALCFHTVTNCAWCHLASDLRTDGSVLSHSDQLCVVSSSDLRTDGSVLSHSDQLCFDKVHAYRVIIRGNLARKVQRFRATTDREI
jgi:hypothetical protein